FRGALQRTLSTFPPLRHISMWIAAFIFSAVHLQFFGFFPRFVMGLFFGYLFYSTGSIWPCVFAHALNNSMVVVMKWLELRGCDLNAAFHKWGVVESGFPLIPFISLLLMILFFSICYDKFFSAKSPVEDSRTKVL
ncbi:MAG: CPBP family intramembrane metalloprotease, partial [Muribaculaceae bacterium]|nr:CPBP family intramembrane metalloprotease [Muribaculaceae bacterium]